MPFAKKAFLKVWLEKLVFVVFHVQAHSCPQGCFEEFVLLGNSVAIDKVYLNLSIQMESLVPQMYLEEITRKSLSFYSISCLSVCLSICTGSQTLWYVVHLCKSKDSLWVSSFFLPCSFWGMNSGHSLWLLNHHINQEGCLYSWL